MTSNGLHEHNYRQTVRSHYKYEFLFLIKGAGALTVVRVSRFRNSDLLTYGTIDSPSSQTLSTNVVIHDRSFFWLMCWFTVLMRNIVLGIQVFYVCDSTIGSKKYNPYYICLTKKDWKNTKLQNKRNLFKLMIINKLWQTLRPWLHVPKCRYNLSLKNLGVHAALSMAIYTWGGIQIPRHLSPPTVNNYS
jgi:hypothetical protein